VEGNGHQSWLGRHRDLAGRASEPWARRVGLLILLALVVSAALGAFGQRETGSSASTAAAALKLKAPERARGGDIFQARVEVRASRQIRQPSLVLDPGWTDGLTQNTSIPQARSERSDNGRIVLDYDTVSAGRKLVVWFEYQVNPTHVGKTKQDIELWDGTTRLVHLDHSLTTFP
jgi:hypothetical protein